MREIQTFSLRISQAQVNEAPVPHGFGPTDLRVHVTMRSEAEPPDGTIRATALSQGGFAVLWTATAVPAPVPPLAKVTRL